jgi:hypothetical protein
VWGTELERKLRKMKFLIPGRLDKVEFGKEKAKEHRKKKADGLGF